MKIPHRGGEHHHVPRGLIVGQYELLHGSILQNSSNPNFSQQAKMPGTLLD
jgi:hypothetical protein